MECLLSEEKFNKQNTSLWKEIEQVCNSGM